MYRMSPALLMQLPDEAADVLAALTWDGPEGAVRLNELVARTGLPTGHVGRHLRTLERERLAAYRGGTWHATLRGMRHPDAEARRPVAFAA